MWCNKGKSDVDVYSFKKGETYYIEFKYAKIITEKEWILVVEDIEKDNEEYNKKALNDKNAKKGKKKKSKIKKIRKNRKENLEDSD